MKSLTFDICDEAQEDIQAIYGVDLYQSFCDHIKSFSPEFPFHLHSGLIVRLIVSKVDIIDGEVRMTFTKEITSRNIDATRD